MLRIVASGDILQGGVLNDYLEASRGTWREDKILMSHGNNEGKGTSLVSQAKGRRRVS